MTDVKGEPVISASVLIKGAPVSTGVVTDFDGKFTQPNAKVGDVWEKTGFLSGSHFGKLFKSRYGLSPREFANKYTDMESYFKQNR